MVLTVTEHEMYFRTAIPSTALVYSALIWESLSCKKKIGRKKLLLCFYAGLSNTYKPPSGI